MKYIVDHDLHIHSYLSSCSRDDEQTNAAILQYALKNGFKKVCVTDHFWDEKLNTVLKKYPNFKWYNNQNYQHISSNLPLPQAEGVKFLFGAETDMDQHNVVGVDRSTMDKFDFLIIPTTHLHMIGFTIDPKDDDLEKRAELYCRRLDVLLDYDLPFHKIGIAHLHCFLAAGKAASSEELKERAFRMFDLIDDSTYIKLFKKAAKKGVGIELNFNALTLTQSELEHILKPYRIAGDCGCKFYFGSDAHHPAELLYAKENFEKIASALELTENQKFVI